jgi:hypothetical protein
MRFLRRNRRSEPALPPIPTPVTAEPTRPPEVAPTPNMTPSRRSDRILTPIRIRVSGVNAAGDPFEEDSITISVNKHGACISLQNVLQPEQEITILNLENGVAAKFRVVGELRQVFGGRREWGVETHCPECNIWGLEFELPPEDAQPKVLVSCAECKNGVLTSLSSIQYDVLLYTGVISRHCEQCGQTTRWVPSGNSPEPQLIARALRPVPAALERRKHRRVHVTMLLRLRNEKGESETVQTLDASKGGVCFLSRRSYRVGECLYFTLPSTDKPAPTETRGCVVRAELGRQGTIYGVRFEKD